VTFLPIVGRELRVASRRRATYWMRSVAALAVIVLGTWMFLMMRQQPQQEVAMLLFGIMTGAAVLYSLFSGVRATADCLSSEKREGTLGLLFLTDLKGYDVVLGKLAATSLSALYGVLAVVPMLAVPLLMGGITLGEFGRMAIVAASTLLFSLAIGICVSAMSRSARSAIGMTFVFIVFFAAFLPAATLILVLLGKARSFQHLLLLPSPGFTFWTAFESQFKSSASPFWWSVGIVQGIGWLSLIVAAGVVPHSWQDKPAGAQRLRWRQRWKQWSYGSPIERVGFRRRLLNKNAFFWLAARARLKPAVVWMVLGLLACGWTWGLAKFRRDWLNVPLYFTTGIILNVLLKGWFAAESGRQLAEDRQRGALELLLSTPMTVRDILRGQRLALQRQFLGPVIFVLLIALVLMIQTGRETIMEVEDRNFFVFVWLGGMLMLMADLVGLYWVGMWQAIVSKNPNRAASATVARILVLPWVAFALAALVISLLGVQTGHEPGANFFLGLLFGLGLAADIGFGVWARHKLLTEFRLAAAQRYEGRRGFLRSLFSAKSHRAPAVQLRPVKET
jgi:ABC-type Na+ efflux pump permease subunit